MFGLIRLLTKSRIVISRNVEAEPRRDQPPLDDNIQLSEIGRFALPYGMTFGIEHLPGGHIRVYNDFLGISGMGDELQSAIEDMEDDLEFYWSEIVMADVSELHHSTFERRKWFIDNIRCKDGEKKENGNNQ